MSYDRARMVSVVRSFVPDDARRIVDDAGGPLDECIGLALDRYSADRPHTAPDPDTMPEGDGTQSLTLPATFIVGFSTATAFEYPVDQVPPELHDERDWTINARAGTVETPGFTVTTGEEWRLHHTTPHKLNDFDGETEATTIPTNHFRIVGTLAASYVCERLASHYAQTADGTLGADIAGYRSKSQEWDSRAKALRKLYTDALFPNAEDGGVAPRGGWVNWDLGASDGGAYTREPAWQG